MHTPAHKEVNLTLQEAEWTPLIQTWDTLLKRQVEDGLVTSGASSHLPICLLSHAKCVHVQSHSYQQTLLENIHTQSVMVNPTALRIKTGKKKILGTLQNHYSNQDEQE